MMFMSESYFSVNKENHQSKIESDISWDAVSLYTRAASESENSQVGRNGSNYDSGHDSYLEDGTGYSGDDEEVLRCDICACPTSNLNLVKPKNRRGKRRHRRRRDLNQLLSKPRDYGDTKFDFEGSASMEKKWTMEYYFDSENLMHRLKRVVIARKGKDDDLENMVVLETAADFSMASEWRFDVLQQTKMRNEREASDFELLPTTQSCDSCLGKRVEEIKYAVNEGIGFKYSLNGDDDDDVFDANGGHKNNNKMGYLGNWRRRILYDLKFGNCQILSFLNSQKRHPSLSTESNGKNINSKLVGHDTSFRDDNWETYDVISDDDLVL